MAEWMPRERWEALVRGEDCPLCAEVASLDAANDEGYTPIDPNAGRQLLPPQEYAERTGKIRAAL